MIDDKIIEMLFFLYKVGKLLYFDEDKLKDIIIIDVQWFLDVFKCIIVYYVNMVYIDY